MAAYAVGFMTHVTCRLTAKSRDQLRNATLGNRVRAAFTFTYTYRVSMTTGALRYDTIRDAILTCARKLI